MQFEQKLLIKNAPALKKPIRLIFYPFQDDRKYPGSGSYVSELFVGYAISIPQWEVIDFSLVKKIIHEKKLSLVGISSNETRYFSDLLNADVIVTGKVESFKKILIFQYQFISVSLKILKGLCLADLSLLLMACV